MKDQNSQKTPKILTQLTHIKGKQDDPDQCSMDLDVQDFHEHEIQCEPNDPLVVLVVQLVSFGHNKVMQGDLACSIDCVVGHS